MGGNCSATGLEFRQTTVRLGHCPALACSRCKVEEDDGEHYIVNGVRFVSRHRAVSEWSSLGRCCAEPMKARQSAALFRAAARAIAVAPRFCLDPRTKRSYELDRSVDPYAIFQMDQDLPRTAGSEPLVRVCKGRIRSMLLRQLAEDPQLGYCQGMNFVAAVFAVAARSQNEAYERFHGFTQRVRGLWMPGFPLLEMGVAHFATVAKERSWFQHLIAHDVRPSMFLPQALMTMFAMWLPLRTVVECLALPERNGLIGMVAMTVAVLDHARDRLLQQHSFEELLSVFRGLQDSPPEPQALAAAASRAVPECISRRSSAKELLRVCKNHGNSMPDPDAIVTAASKVVPASKRKDQSNKENRDPAVRVVSDIDRLAV